MIGYAWADGKSPILLVHPTSRFELSAEQRLNVSAPSHDMKNANVFLFDAIENNVFAYGKAAHIRA
jgi:hypothetical protein